MLEQPCHKTHVVAIAFSPDSKWAVTGAADGEVLLHDGSNDSVVGRWKLKNAVRHIQFSPDGTRVAVCAPSARGTPNVAVFSVAHGTVCSVLRTRAARDVTALDWAPDGAQIALAHRPLSGIGTAVTVWDADGGVLRHRLPHHGVATLVTFASGGSVLASGGEDATCRIWDRATGQLRTLLVHSHGHLNLGRTVVAAAFAPDDALVATACLDGSVWLWNAVTGALLVRTLAWAPMMNFGAGARSISFSPDGTALWLVARTAGVHRHLGAASSRRTWSFVEERHVIADISCKQVLPATTGRSTRLVMSPSSKWPLNTIMNVSHLVLSPDGSRLAIVEAGGKVTLHGTGVRL